MGRQAKQGRRLRSCARHAVRRIDLWAWRNMERFHNDIQRVVYGIADEPRVLGEQRPGSFVKRVLRHFGVG